ncbi:SRPBCC family protein [Chryseobacterium capnotolerans]|uniref:SRPBCC family protein n=1 Tax=Chryseobacterium capnotolerans TaxID=2759528 RepID=UPI003211AA52
MSRIYLKTLIDADIQTVFDLARNIDLHQQSTSRTHEKAIAGRMSGLIEENETVTWRAKHLGVYQNLTTKIISMEKTQSVYRRNATRCLQIITPPAYF